MDLISIQSATKTAITDVLDLSMTVNPGDGEVSGFPFTYNPGDTAPMAGLVKAYLADHTDLTIGDYVAPAITAAQVDAERQRRRYLPLSVTVPSGTFSINMDEVSQANIQGLATVGMYITNSGSSQTTTFRDYANAEHALTPADLVALGLAVAAHIQALYVASWTLKATSPIPTDYTADSYWS